MNYCLFKLKFSTSVHIGSSENSHSLETGIMTFCADTLFSGLMHMAVRMDGNAGIQRLWQASAHNGLAFSDAMPYKDGRLYLPKPLANPVESEDFSPVKRKLLKKIQFIPVDIFTEYCHGLTGRVSFSLSKIDNDFGYEHLAEKVGLLGFEKSEPYSVGLFSFHEGCGLYIVVGYVEDEDISYIKRLMSLLGYSGIGGKISSGYGKFSVESEVELNESTDCQTKLLRNMLNAADATRYMTLTAALPKDKELDDAMCGSTYSLIRRAGFVQSDQLDTPRKKQVQYFFSAGSLFKNHFEGDIYDVFLNGSHPVHRYGKPLFVGVDI